jgi:hypothetical protein
VGRGAPNRSRLEAVPIMESGLAGAGSVAPDWLYRKE